MHIDGHQWNQPTSGYGSNIMLEPDESAIVQLCGLVLRIDTYDGTEYVRVNIDTPAGSRYPVAKDGLPAVDVTMRSESTDVDSSVRVVVTCDMLEESRRFRACMSAVSAVPTTALRQAVARVLAAAEGTGSGEVVEQLRALVRDART